VQVTVDCGARGKACVRSGSAAYQNPKSQARNPKQTETGKTEIQNPKRACLEFSVFLSIEFVSNFGFRIWDLTLCLLESHLFPIRHAKLTEKIFG
jgi:hypothetical protein